MLILPYRSGGKIYITFEQNGDSLLGKYVDGNQELVATKEITGDPEVEDVAAVLDSLLSRISKINKNTVYFDTHIGPVFDDVAADFQLP